MENQTLNVAYGTDENYVKLVATSMMSLFESNQDFLNINVYVIENNVSQKSIEFLKDVVKNYGRNINFVSLKDISEGLKLNTNFSISSFSRLFLANISGVDKIVYLDCDSIVNDTFNELWKMDISDYYIAGVLDTVELYNKRVIGLPDDTKYINAGFQLINLKKWRDDNLVDKCLDFINSFHGNVPHHDQGTVNGVCNGKIKILHPKYNLMGPMLIYNTEKIKKLYGAEYYYTQEMLDEAIANPIFIHFTADYFNRPWFQNCTHPMKDIFLKYYTKTPWGTKLENVELCRNAKIMRFLYNNIPFFMYNKLNEYRLRKKFLKIKQKIRR
jgi:lipopolysaccharide biosynthesis glycosyltransferase